jgi:hypothetical protein
VAILGRAVFGSLLLLQGLVVLGSIRGDAQSPCSNCIPDTSSQDIVIDARTGKASGRGSREVDEVVRVFLINKNPFAFRYRFVTRTISIESQSYAPLLKQVGLPIGKTEGTTTTAAPPPVSTKAVCPDVQYAKASVFDTALATRAHLIDSALNMAIAEERQRVAPLFASVMTRLEATALYDSAHAFRAAMRTFRPDTPTFKLQALTVDTLVSLLRTEVALIADTTPTCRGERTRMLAHSDSAAVLLAHLTISLKNLISRQVAYDRVATAVDVSDSAGTPYYDTLTVGPFTKGTIVTIRVESASITEPTKLTKLGSMRLTFGGPPVLSVAGGLAVAFLERRQYGTAVALQRDTLKQPIPSDTLGNFKTQRVVSLTECSPLRLSPVLALHARVTNLGERFSAYATLASTAKSSDQGIDTEWLFGVSVGSFDEAFFGTMGLYVGRITRLAAGYHENDPLPVAVNDPPVHRDYGAGFAIMVSYHL